MALKGIESQVVMQRTGEYMKETAIAQKRGELNVEDATRQVQAEEQEFAEQIRRLEQKENHAVENNLENREGGGYQPSFKKRKKRRKDEQGENKGRRKTDTNENKIDIRI